MRKIIKQTSYVELQNPIVFPAPLARDPNRIQSRFSRSVAVGVWQEYGIQIRLNQLFDHHLRDSIADRGHSAGELHLYPTKLWDRVRSRTRFTRYVANSLSF